MDYRLKIETAVTGSTYDFTDISLLIGAIQDAVSRLNEDGELITFKVEACEEARWEAAWGFGDDVMMQGDAFDTEAEARARAVAALADGASQVHVMSPDQVRQSREWNRRLHSRIAA